MEILRALKKAIFDQAVGSASLSALVDSKVFDTTVPPGIEPPWVRFYVVALAEENVLLPHPPIASRIRVAFDIVSESEVATEAENILEALTGVFDGAALVEEGWTFAFRRESKRKVYDTESQAWTITVEYSIVAHTVA